MKNKKIWAFNSGATFSGNPKWLFLYIQTHRKDIKCYWLCDTEEIAKQIRNKGYEAYFIKSNKGKRICEIAGVYVVNQVKEYLPNSMNDTVILNLWHGVGGKTIERKLNFSYIREKVAKKYIKYNQYYINNQLFLVTSPYMEKHFIEQCGLEEDQLIRAGYPCNLISDRNLISSSSVKKYVNNQTKKLVLYAPTYRYYSPNDFFIKAIPDIVQLEKALIENNMIMIFKFHPMMKNDAQFKFFKEKYKSNENFIFWDDNDDIYEIFDEIELAIVDYSSIFYDLLAANVQNYLRYVFDFNENTNIEGLIFDYKEMTTGYLCRTFDELITRLKNYKYEDKGDIKRIYNTFWEYSSDDSFEKIIEKALCFNPKKIVLPELYSFDIFDTLIQRKTLEPVGIFHYVKEKAEQANLNFSMYFLNNYPKIRREAEANIREFYSKSIRNSEKIEISFDEIFERIKNLYSLDEKQVYFLKETEIYAELINCEPIPSKIEMVEELINSGETVVLISDMYLPKEVILKILENANPILTKIPLYLSSEYGNRKTNRKLFLDVYDDLDYKYSNWNHYGDNKVADGREPEKLGINTHLHKIVKFNAYERYIVNKISSYDSYLISNIFARFRENSVTTEEYFSYSIVSLYFVPYVKWVINNALTNNIETLYFLSRDGHFLKIIADEIIKEKKLGLKTSYLYGSRKAWRVPSYINEIDDEFFGPFGNFTGVKDFNSLLSALEIDENTFNYIFKDFIFIKEMKKLDKSNIERIISFAKNSNLYRKNLLETAEKKRILVEEYLIQEIDFQEKFAFVEYWGRGYTQDCLDRILNNIHNEEVKTIFYYARSIYPNIKTSVRYNFTTSTQKLNFIEAIFANLPYKSIHEYETSEGKVVPVINENRHCNMTIYNSMDKNLRLFTREFLKCNFLNDESITRSLFDVGLNFYRERPNDIAFVKCLAPLKYSESLNGEAIDFAPPIEIKHIMRKFFNKQTGFQTYSLKTSMIRSSKLIKHSYSLYKGLGINTIRFKIMQFTKKYRKLIGL